MWKCLGVTSEDKYEHRKNMQVNTTLKIIAKVEPPWFCCLLQLGKETRWAYLTARTEPKQGDYNRKSVSRTFRQQD